MLLIMYEHEGKNHLGVTLEFFCSPLGLYVIQKSEGEIHPQVVALPVMQISLYSLPCIISFLLKIPTLLSPVHTYA